MTIQEINSVCDLPAVTAIYTHPHRTKNIKAHSQRCGVAKAYIFTSMCFRSVWTPIRFCTKARCMCVQIGAHISTCSWLMCNLPFGQTHKHTCQNEKFRLVIIENIINSGKRHCYIPQGPLGNFKKVYTKFIELIHIWRVVTANLQWHLPDMHVVCKGQILPKRYRQTWYFSHYGNCIISPIGRHGVSRH